jgi:hypothetical protein
MNNSNEGNIIFVDAFKLAMKTIESLHKKVNEQNDVIESLCNDVENIKNEIKNMNTNKIKDNKSVPQTGDDEQWNEYINEETEDEPVINKNTKNNKILKFVTNKLDKNIVESKPNDKNRIRRETTVNKGKEIEKNKEEEKNIKVQKLISGLMKKKNECEDEINKIKIEMDETNNSDEAEEEEVEVEEEKKEENVKIRRRGARF